MKHQRRKSDTEQRRGSGPPSSPPPPPPLENHKGIGIPSNTVPDPLGHHQPASETPFKWCLLAGRRWSAFSGIWILSPKNKAKKTFWIHTCYAILSRLCPIELSILMSIHIVLSQIIKCFSFWIHAKGYFGKQ